MSFCCNFFPHAKIIQSAVYLGMRVLSWICFSLCASLGRDISFLSYRVSCMMWGLLVEISVASYGERCCPKLQMLSRDWAIYEEVTWH